LLASGKGLCRLSAWFRCHTPCKKTQGLRHGTCSYGVTPPCIEQAMRRLGRSNRSGISAGGLSCSYWDGKWLNGHGIFCTGLRKREGGGGVAYSTRCVMPLAKVCSSDGNCSAWQGARHKAAMVGQSPHGRSSVAARWTRRQ